MPAAALTRLTARGPAPSLVELSEDPVPKIRQMRVAAQIRSKLTDALKPVLLEIVDESHRHKGHAGARPNGETHFRVEIVSDAFRGKSRLERQRLIYAALAEEMSHDIHALSLSARTPEEMA